MTSLDKQYAALSAGWRPDSRAAMVDYLSAEAKRQIVKTAYKDPADLAAAVDPNYVITPALRLIAENIEQVLAKPRHNLCVTMSPQEGKLVELNTPVPTPTGWRKHGELAPGDWVFHPSGKPIRVLARHDNNVADRRVHLSDHTYVDVHHKHEWTVVDSSRRQKADKRVCSHCGATFTSWQSREVL